MNSVTFNFYDRTVCVNYADRRLQGAIDRLQHSLKHISTAQTRPSVPPVGITLRRTSAELPETGRLLSPPHSPLKIRANSHHISLNYDESHVIIDLKSGRASCFFTDDVFEYPRLISHGFLMTTMVMMLHARSLFFLHAACLENSGRGFLIVADSGSGKSTNAIQLVEAGWNYLSDDTLWLENQTGRVHVLAIPNAFKLSDEQIQTVSRKHLLDRSYKIFDNDKHFVDIGHFYPNQFRPKVPASVLVFPQIVDRATSTIQQMSKFEALTSLINESPLLHVPHSRNVEQLETLKTLVNQCPAYRLLAGQDLLKNTEILPRILSELLAEENTYVS